MKIRKTICVLSALTLLFCLAGCGEKKSVPAPGTDLSVFYQGLLDAQSKETEELVFFPETSPEVVESFYPGLSELDLSQELFYLPPVTGFVCEVMLVEVADEKDVPAVEKIFQARIDAGAADTGYPETAAQWKTNASVQSAGVYVGMVALPDGYEIPENLFTAE